LLTGKEFPLMSVEDGEQFLILQESLASLR
jgi:hypothetical protein